MEYQLFCTNTNICFRSLARVQWDRETKFGKWEKNFHNFPGRPGRVGNRDLLSAELWPTRSIWVKRVSLTSHFVFWLIPWTDTISFEFKIFCHLNRIRKFSARIGSRLYLVGNITLLFANSSRILSDVVRNISNWFLTANLFTEFEVSERFAKLIHKLISWNSVSPCPNPMVFREFHKIVHLSLKKAITFTF